MPSPLHSGGRDWGLKPICSIMQVPGQHEVQRNPPVLQNQTNQHTNKKTSNCLTYLRLPALFPALQMWRRVREMAQWKKTDLVGTICKPALLQCDGKYNEIPRSRGKLARSAQQYDDKHTAERRETGSVRETEERLESCPFSTHCIQVSTWTH